MSNFALNQGSGVSSGQWADLTVPGCGMMTSEGQYPIIRVEIKDGKATLYVWSDINAEDPTHVINLTDALLSNRKEEDGIEPAPEEASKPGVRGLWSGLRSK